MSSTIITGLGLGLALGASLALLIAAVRGWQPQVTRSRTLTTVTKLSRQERRRLGYAGAAAVIVALLTKWPVATIAAGAAVWLWPRMSGARRVTEQHVERLESLALWVESLRDSIAGSIGLEEAILHSVKIAPEPLQGPLGRLEGQLRVQVPLPEALAGFAGEFEDASADLAVAALILNASLRGPGLVQVLTKLADSTREEIDMRRRMEVEGRTLRRNANVVVGVLAVFGGALTLFSRAYLAPYSSPLGQIVLLAVLGIFAAGLVVIRSSANIKAPERFLVGADGISGALQAGSNRGVSR